MKNINFIIFITFFIFFLYGCIQKKREKIVPEEKKTVIMPVSIRSDTTVYELKIAPDTFSILSNIIPTILINHLEEDAFYGDDISYEYYNDSIGKWENAKTPSNLISTYVLWRIPAQSEIKAEFNIFDNRPGKYRFIITILKPRCLKVVSEYVLSTTSDRIMVNKNNHTELENAEQAAIRELAFNNYQEIVKLFGNGDKSYLLETKDYPSYYGGSYTNKKGQFIIFITGDTLKAKERFSKITDKTNTIFQNCEYSYKTLIEIMDTIRNKVKSKAPASKYLNDWWIEERENRVFVFLNKQNDEVISEFKQNITDSPAIIFKKSSRRIVYD